MKRTILIIATLSFSVLSMLGQEGRIKKADKLYNKLAYAQAVKYYNSILEQGVDSSKVAKQMADSYYQMRDPENAQKWYAIVVKNSPAPKDYLRYAEVLKGTGNYMEASKYMAKYNELDATDSRAAAHVRNQNYYEELTVPTDRFTLRNEESNSSQADFSPMYYGDKKVVFVSNRDLLGVSIKRNHKWNNEPFLNLFSSNIGNEGRLETVLPFSEKVNTKFHEGPMAFSKDLKTMYFTRNNYVNNKKNKSSDDIVKLKLLSSNRTDLGWSDPVEFPFNSDEYSVGHPALSADGKTLYFVSDMPGGYGGTDLWKSEMTSGAWSKPVNLGDRINSEGNEMFPFIHADGTLYYSSDGLLGLGGLDVFEAKADANGFSAPENLAAPLNSKKDDFGFIANSEKTEGYVSSNRANGKGNDDIYHFFMKDKKALTVSGFVANADEEMNALLGARVRLLDDTGKEIESKLMGPEGTFKFELDPEICGYQIQVDNGEGWTDYAYDNVPCDVDEGDIGLGQIPLEEMKWGARGSIKEKNTNQPLEGFEVTFTDRETGEGMVKTTGTNGSVKFNLDGEKVYDVKFEKEGFFTKTGEISTVGVEPGMLEIQRYIDLTMERIELGKGIKIENIYYDYNKSFIRPDAALELNKIVLLMIDNPTIKVEMGSHTDARGSDAYNLKLSQRRAKAAMDYIIAQGIDKGRMSSKGYGETTLINNCKDGVTCSDELHEENRRTEFKVVGFVEGLED
ncbi:MAG: OmpA family protein [Flavobacteriales bacterium]